MDHFSQRIYWADLELSVIGSVLYDGSDSVVSVSSKQGLQSTFIFAFNYYLEFQIMIHKYENFTFWISSNSFSFQLVTLTIHCNFHSYWNNKESRPEELFDFRTNVVHCCPDSNLISLLLLWMFCSEQNTSSSQD